MSGAESACLHALPESRSSRCFRVAQPLSRAKIHIDRGKSSLMASVAIAPVAISVLGEALDAGEQKAGPGDHRDRQRASLPRRDPHCSEREIEEDRCQLRRQESAAPQLREHGPLACTAQRVSSVGVQRHPRWEAAQYRPISQLLDGKHETRPGDGTGFGKMVRRLGIEPRTY